MQPKIDTITITSRSSFLIKSRHSLYPITFTSSPSLTDLPITSHDAGFSNTDYFTLLVVKNGKLYRYSRQGKLGPIAFQIEDDKVSLTPFAVSKDGVRYFCCDSFIGELVDTGIDIICVSENIYFLYNSIEQIGRFVNFENTTGNFTPQTRRLDYFQVRDLNSMLKKLDLREICYYYLAKALEITFLISRNCNF